MGLFSRTLSRLDELKRVLTKDPGSRQFLALADEYRRQGEVREAIEVLERGLAQNPGSVAGHVALGRFRQQAGLLDDATASFQEALKLDPQNLVALRQLAELHLAKGDKVEAIKKLKLFRRLSPGDRDVDELILQLDEELSAAAAPRIPMHPASPPPPPSELLTGVTARTSAHRIAIPPPPPLPQPAGTPLPAPAAPERPPQEFLLPPSAEPAAPPSSDERKMPPFEEVFPVQPDAVPDAQVAERSAAETGAAPTAGGEPPFGPETLEIPEGSAAAGEEAAAGLADGPAPVAAVTETLAELLRAQGHLGGAREAYEELARSESDADRARRLHEVAEEISAARRGTVRGRLEAWGEPFSRSGPRGTDLVTAVERVVARLGRAVAVVTDFEGVPVVSAGALAEAEAMEILAAELTAFWKNVRRSRAEIGEGALDSLVLSGSAGTAAVKVITPAYALLLKAGPGIPGGRIRFEAARAAEQLRPALL